MNRGISIIFYKNKWLPGIFGKKKGSSLLCHILASHNLPPNVKELLELKKRMHIFFDTVFFEHILEEKEKQVFVRI